MDTPTFLKRALKFQAELQRNSFPNASSLAEACKCSRSTAMRTIDRLRYEFGFPIGYNESERGFFLTTPDFSFASLPAGQDELVALILLGELVALIDDDSLELACNALWARCTNGRSDLSCDLIHIAKRFSSETTSIAKLADINLVQLLLYAHRGQPLRLTYRSPWRHEHDREYHGTFERLHYSDGILYGMLHEHTGRQIVLNISFIKSLQEVDTLPECAEEQNPSENTEPYWLEGFGVWSGTKPLSISIVINAPASRYYSEQIWHAEQVDEWHGDNLRRTFPGIPSPELSRRILSLGRFVGSVEPPEVLKLIEQDVAKLVTLIKEV